METTTVKKKTVQTKKKEVVLLKRSRIRPRGLVGWMKGKIHYDESADIFDLDL